MTTTSSSVNGASGTVALPMPGVYEITLVGPIENVLSHAVVFQNYTWTVNVAAVNQAAGCGSCSTSGSAKNVKDPHPGVIDTYEVAPGGATSIDPVVDYESVGYEVIANIYQTLVYYNGSSTNSYMPEIATCVPGTSQCSDLYGNDLITNNATTGLPQYWTFVIDKNANFYDPTHGVAWGVYPTDVMATFARTASFADLPFFGAQPGWIQTQSYVNFGQHSFDGAMHFPYNTTPQGILSGLLVNDSNYCPSVAITQEHGCITFNAWGGGSDWPFFLELVSDPDGAAIEPCGWFGAQGAGLPGFGTTAANGDGPCALPGGAGTGGTTNSATWANWLDNTTSIYAWDSYQNNSYNSPNVFPQTRFNAVGSGPYYLVSVNKGVGYVLQASPVYAQPNCAGNYWCEPSPGNVRAHGERILGAVRPSRHPAVPPGSGRLCHDPDIGYGYAVEPAGRGQDRGLHRADHRGVLRPDQHGGQHDHDLGLLHGSLEAPLELGEFRLQQFLLVRRTPAVPGERLPLHPGPAAGAQRGRDCLRSELWGRHPALHGQLLREQCHLARGSAGFEPRGRGRCGVVVGAGQRPDVAGTTTPCSPRARLRPPAPSRSKGSRATRCRTGSTRSTTSTSTR